MEKEEMVVRTREILNTPTCSTCLKENSQHRIDAIGSERERDTAAQFIAEGLQRKNGKGVTPTSLS